MADFSRQQFRFKNGGMKTNDPPDALTDGKYVFLQNTRGTEDNGLQERPQFLQTIAAPTLAGAVQSLEPTLGVYKVGSSLYVNRVQIDAGYSPTLGASILPFRPNESPNAWDYVFDDLKSTKVYIPPSGSPVVKNVGIVEPQAPLDAAVVNQYQSLDFAGSYTSGWTAGGTASSPGAGGRVTDTIGVVIADPASSGARQSCQISPSQIYSRGMNITFGSGSVTVVDDVLPNLTSALSIAAIYYYSGVTGRCVVVPGGLSGSSDSIYSQLLLAHLRRGSLVQIGSEICLVLNVTTGPTGNICFETSTTGTHTTSDALLVVDTIVVLGGGPAPGPAPAPTNGVTSPSNGSTITSGIGTLTKSLSSNPFVYTNFSFQPDDYIHISVKIDTLANLNELKLLLDVGDGTFTENFYFYTVRPSDIAQGVQNTLTQLATAQIVEQRSIIDQEISIKTAHQQGSTSSSGQTGPGDHQWSEIYIPIRALTRVGDDQTKTLQNANAVQVLVNANATVTLHFNSLNVIGGYQADIGDSVIPYFYWAVPRDSTTGATGNPSPPMRYGINPRRQQVYVTVPSTYPDPQMDTWDIFRQGADLDTERYLGSIPIGTTNFLDNYADSTIALSRAMQRDNYQPFPSVGPPIVASDILSSAVYGTVMLLTFPSSTPTNPSLQQVASLLPGNEFNIGQQVFTLWARPTFVAALLPAYVWMFQLVENAGVLTNPLVQLNEPTLAAQRNQCVWGPDSNGVFFAVQDPLRPGFVSHTNPNNPDSASDAYNDELCPPSEPLQNGVLQNQTSIVFSPNRAWAGYPQQGGSGYRWNEIPVGAGLAAQQGICTDGEQTYYIAKDGIRMTSGGPSKSLTDADLYNLFPHEGTFPTPVVTVGGTAFPPDYGYANQMRLAVVNGFLFFDYIYSAVIGGIAVLTYHTLVMDLRTQAWSIDVSGFNSVTIHAATTLPSTAGTTKNQQLYLGDSTGAIYVEGASAENIACVVATREIMSDLRASSMFGDASLDCAPADGSMTINPVSFGLTIAVPTTAIGPSTRQNVVVDLQGQQIIRSLGLLIQWLGAGQPATLYSWGVSLVPQPENTATRFSDWDDGGRVGAKFYQGFILECDTFGQDKQITIRSADDGVAEQTFQINHNGQQEKPYSFTTPFISHLVRDEPDSVPWRKFGIKFIYEPCPSATQNWITQGTTFGLVGYLHVKEVLAAYSSTSPVTLTITCYDGNEPQVITLPPTGGQYSKIKVVLTANKGLLYFFSAVSLENFRIYLNAWECKVKAWGSSDSYINYVNLGSEGGDQARI